MATMTRVDNGQDIIDSRDIIERIEELRHCCADRKEADELKALLDLQEEASGSPDWEYGEGLIRRSYFKTYAQEFADDIGAIDANAGWPTHCIDWDQAARELEMDYFEVDYDGVEYLIRA